MFFSLPFQDFRNAVADVAEATDFRQQRISGGSGVGGVDESGIAQKQKYRLPLPPHPIASRQAHKILEWALLGWCVHGTVADDAHIVLGELVTNALTHSMDVFTLALCIHADRILIEVWDCTDASPKVTLPEGLAVNGRGMFLVDALTKEWGVRPEKEGGKTVWAAVPR